MSAKIDIYSLPFPFLIVSSADKDVIMLFILVVFNGLKEKGRGWLKEG
jgi:hypothetical protein